MKYKVCIEIELDASSLDAALNRALDLVPQHTADGTELHVLIMTSPSKRKKRTTRSRSDRDPNKEYPPYRPIPTPVTFRGQDVSQDSLKRMLQNERLLMEEAEYTESFEEANDFGPDEDEDEDFLNGYTVYEMHEIQAEMAQVEASPNFPTPGQPSDPTQSAAAPAANGMMVESNETDGPGEAPTMPSRTSAPAEPHSPSSPILAQPERSDPQTR